MNIEKILAHRFTVSILSGLGIGVVLQWLTLFFSYKELPNAYEDIYEPIATGGFPYVVFEYPVPPMGSDWPPADVWPMFFMNFAIWLLVGLVLGAIFGKKIQERKLLHKVLTLAGMITIFGYYYIVFKFD